MQVINLEATISTPSLQVEMRTLRLGSGGGTTDYDDLSNKPKLEGVTLQGNVPISALGLRTSDLINDSGFITTGDIPTKTSDLTNDSNFQDATQVANAISAAIPTNVSSFTNDVGYITAADIPTNVSAFTNDAGYLTSGDLPAFAVDSVNGQTGTVVLTGADIECGGSYHTNDAISTQIDAFTTDIANLTANMPSKTSDLQNDSGYITAAGAPVQSVNGQTGDVTITVPTDTNDLTNGAGYITAAEAPVQSVNGATGTVVLDGADIEYSSGVTINSKIDSVEAAIPTDTTTIENVSIATLQDGDYDKAVNELIVNIDADVNGYTEANIVVCRTNVWDEAWEVGNIDNTTGENVSSAITIRSKNHIYVRPDTSYCFHIGSIDVFVKVVFYDQNNNVVLVKDGASGGIHKNTVFTTPQNCTSIRFVMASAYGTTYINDISINYPSTDNTYHAYEGTTYNIPFGQSVTTGGTLNVTTGVLEITGGSTVSLTPTEVKTLIEYNNIYSDSGDLKKLTYYKLSPLGVYNWVKTQI